MATRLRHAAILRCVAGLSTVTAVLVGAIFHLMSQVPTVVARPLCVFYDNFLIIAKSKDLRDKIRQQIDDNATYYQLIWKTDPESRPDAWCNTHNECSFLGGQYRSSNGKLVWAHIASNIVKWRNKKRHVKLGDSIRTVQGLTGVLMWDLSLRLKRTSDIADVAKLLSILGHQSYDNRSHDVIAKLTGDDLEAINSAFDRMLINTPSERSRALPMEEDVIVTTDSSGIAAGIVELFPSNNQKFELLLPFTKWSPLDLPRDIWEKEFLTAIRALRIILDRFPQPASKATRLWLVVDNSITFYVLLRMLSSSDEMNTHLPVVEQLEAKNVFMKPILVPSADMPADTPSRDAPLDSADFKGRVTRCHATVSAHICSERQGLRNPASKPPAKRMRKQLDQK